jgi:hypothetical protein
LPQQRKPDRKRIATPGMWHLTRHFTPSVGEDRNKSLQ